MACPGCPAAIDEPRPEDPLPTDDALWDEGVGIILTNAFTLQQD